MSELKFGIFDWVEASDTRSPGEVYEHKIALAAAADQAGFHGMYLAEHQGPRVAAAGGKRDHCDGWFQLAVGGWLDHWSRPRRPDPVGAHRLGSAFHVALAEILDVSVERWREQIAHVGRDDDFPGTGDRSQARGELEVAPVDTVIVDDQLAGLNPHADQHLALRRHWR